MILTKEIALRAKALIGSRGIIYVGVCEALDKASDGLIYVYNKEDSFWETSKTKSRIFKWPLTKAGDIKRRAFIDSLIGKDL